MLRLSGPSAIAIADEMFEGKTALHSAVSHRVYHGRLFEHDAEKRYLDEVLVTVFRAPNSYTCEDVIEISCHGGAFLTQRILELLLQKGARLAERGEFTQRAFLNGRLDLSQAEAVADLISAKTEMSLRSAVAQFEGALSERVKAIRQGLLDICSLLELELDFAEEDVEFASRPEVMQRMTAVMGEIAAFLSTYERGKVLREGVRLVIVGKPNVGKSSLMNALLKEERAIVTEIPGTTRDAIEEQIDIRGVLFRIVDTAGVRRTADRVEQIGVERTLKEIRAADLVLFLFDGSQPLDDEDRDVIKDVAALRNGSGEDRFIGAVNKIDLERKLDQTAIRELLGERPILALSATEEMGFRQLEDLLVEQSIGREQTNPSETPMITNLRQKQGLERALQSLDKARDSLEQKLSSEFVAVDLRQALDHLGEIIGQVTTEDILGNIFSRFCIGK